MTAIAFLLLTQTTANPEIRQMPARPYVGISVRTTMNGMPSVAPDNFPKLFAWLSAHDIKPDGPPFIRYKVIDMAHFLQVEAGIPIAIKVKGDAKVRCDELPQGPYATYLYTGIDLVKANAELQAWARKKNITFARSETPQGTVWAPRVEFYLTDPRTQPDRSKWQTRIEYMILSK